MDELKKLRKERKRRLLRKDFDDFMTTPMHDMTIEDHLIVSTLETVFRVTYPIVITSVATIIVHKTVKRINDV